MVKKIKCMRDYAGEDVGLLIKFTNGVQSDTCNGPDHSDETPEANRKRTLLRELLEYAK